MPTLVIAMLLCLAAGAVVLGYVAVHARRDGRDLLTPQGEEVVASVREQGRQTRQHWDGVRRRARRTRASD